MQITAPAAEAHQLDWFIGTWKIDSRVKMSDNEWLDEQATSTVQPMINGNALLEVYSGMLGGNPIEGVSLRTYNSNRSRWEQQWIDNGTPGFTEYIGEYKDGQFIGQSSRNFRPVEQGGRGEQLGVREIFSNIEATRFSWRLESSRDGGLTWEPVWTLEYTREA